MTFQVLCVAFSPDNDHFVSGSSDGSVKVEPFKSHLVWQIHQLIKVARTWLNWLSSRLGLLTLLKTIKGLGGGHQAVSPHIHRPFWPSKCSVCLFSRHIGDVLQVWSVKYNKEGNQVVSVSDDKSVNIYSIPVWNTPYKSQFVNFI